MDTLTVRLQLEPNAAPLGRKIATNELKIFSRFDPEMAALFTTKKTTYRDTSIKMLSFRRNALHAPSKRRDDNTSNY